MGMVRQWQELLHEKNYSESYTAALPDFIKLQQSHMVVLVLEQKHQMSWMKKLQK